MMKDLHLPLLLPPLHLPLLTATVTPPVEDKVVVVIITLVAEAL